MLDQSAHKLMSLVTSLYPPVSGLGAADLQHSREPTKQHQSSGMARKGLQLQIEGWHGDSTIASDNEGERGVLRIAN